MWPSPGHNLLALPSPMAESTAAPHPFLGLRSEMAGVRGAGLQLRGSRSGSSPGCLLPSASPSQDHYPDHRVGGLETDIQTRISIWQYSMKKNSSLESTVAICFTREPQQATRACLSSTVLPKSSWAGVRSPESRYLTCPQPVWAKHADRMRSFSFHHLPRDREIHT